MIVRTRLLNLLLFAALVVAVSRLWGFLHEPPPQLPSSDALADKPPAAAPADEKNGAPVGTPAGGYETIVARDLFSAARGVVAPAPDVANPTPTIPQAQPKLILSGVVILDHEKTAYLQEVNKEARPRKVREGETFAGGTLRAIKPDGVTFFFAGNETIVPLRLPKEAAAGAPRPAEVQPVVPVPGSTSYPAPPGTMPWRGNPNGPMYPVIPQMAPQNQRLPSVAPNVRRLPVMPGGQLQAPMPVDDTGVIEEVPQPEDGMEEVDQFQIPQPGDDGGM